MVDRLKGVPLLRNSAIFLSGSLLAGLFGYVFHFEIGRLLGPAGYAVVASAIAALYLLTLPAVVIQLVTARFSSIAAARGDLSSLPGMLARITGFSIAVAAPVIVFLFIFAPAIGRFFQFSDSRIVYVLAFAGATTLLATINRGALQGLSRFVSLSGNMVLDTGSRVVLAGMLILLGLGPVGAFAAVMAGPAIAYAQSLYSLRTLARGGVAEKLEGVGAYAVIASIGAIGVNYLFTVDTLLAKHYLNADSAGIYAAASVLARVIYFLGLTVAGAMFPEVATLQARNQAHFHVVDLSLLLVAAMGVALIVAYTAFPWLVLLPFGSSFERVAPYLGTFAAALTMLALANILINYFLSIARSTFIAPLVGACILETTLIAFFHSSIWQILTMVAVSLGALVLGVGLLYADDRRRARAMATP